ncbi:MAG TPA: class F sortase [Gaiellaceae bacterium]|nr:class F sortase [Gaiellaceae bacterium]
MTSRRLATAVSLVAFLVAPGLASAATPPDPHDPCARAGRDSCGTAGVGFYGSYRYGLRWFGDYHAVLPGASHVFCLDLRFWYASRAYRYRRQLAALRNRDGIRVSLERQRRIGYAIWRYGRSHDPVRQAAVMLYVHAMMGDARPGEVDPAAVGHGVAALYRQVARDSARYHGPYRVSVRLPSRLLVERPATAAIRVLSARGKPLPYVRLGLAVDGADGAAARLRADAAGVARVRLTPTTTAGLRLRVRTGPLAAPRLRVFAPTAPAARANGQRLAVPSAQAVTGTTTRADVHAAPRLATHASAQTTAPGGAISVTVDVSGVGGSTVTVHVALWGPFASRGAIACSGVPHWTGTIVAHGNGAITTPQVPLDRAGYYAFQETIAAGPQISAFVTPCGERQETTFVHARPVLATRASAELVRPGSLVSDRIRVESLGATPAAVEVELFGPFASRGSIRCVYRRLRWHGRIAISGNGTTRSPEVKVDRAGFYAYRERLIGTPLVAGTTTPCPVGTETALAAPQIVTGRGDTAVYAAAAKAGADTPVRIAIAGLGIDAPVLPSAIDLADGVLGIPEDVHRVGWWRDGSAPGDPHGTILVAGHVDSARAGAGAFFRLAGARPRMLVRLVTAGGRRVAYRVTAVRSYAKSDLPLDVFATGGPPRLVLVTCGGPFDAATGHYRDNIVVTAVPVRG